jgi:hypothetical protein
MTYHSSGRKVTQLKITVFQKQFNYYIFLIRVFEIEESETADTYVGKKGVLHTYLPVITLYVGPIVIHKN